MQDSLVKLTSHILMGESHDTSISAMVNSIYNITSIVPALRAGVIHNDK